MLHLGFKRGCAPCHRGVTNEFIIDDEELGELLEVTVGHDSSGYSPSWHLDHLTITNTKTGQTFIFPCRCAAAHLREIL